MYYKEDNATYTYLERTYVHVRVEEAVGQHAIAKMVVVRKSQVYKNLSQYYSNQAYRKYMGHLRRQHYKSLNFLEAVSDNPCLVSSLPY